VCLLVYIFPLCCALTIQARVCITAHKFPLCCGKSNLQAAKTEVRHVRYMQSGTVDIAGYTEAIEQPFLVYGYGEHIRCKIGDSRLILKIASIRPGIEGYGGKIFNNLICGSALCVLHLATEGIFCNWAAECISCCLSSTHKNQQCVSSGRCHEFVYLYVHMGILKVCKYQSMVISSYVHCMCCQDRESTWLQCLGYGMHA
jgi:hypothetical protein